MSWLNEYLCMRHLRKYKFPLIESSW